MLTQALATTLLIANRRIVVNFFSFAKTDRDLQNSALYCYGTIANVA